MFTGGKTPDVNARGYTQIMKEQLLRGEENEVRVSSDCTILIPSLLLLLLLQLRKKILEKAKDGSLKSNGEVKTAPKKRGRWDQTVEESPVPAKKKTLGVSTTANSNAATPLWDADVSKSHSPLCL